MIKWKMSKNDIVMREELKMICGNCGNFIADGQTNCPSCGAPVMSGMNPNMGIPQPGFQQMGYAQPGLTKGQFYKHPNMTQCRKEIRSCGIAMYILAGLNLIVMLTQDLGMAIDVLLILALGLIIHLAQSRVAAVILTVYGVVNLLYFIVVQGQLGGYLFLIIGIISSVYTFKFQKAWKEYKSTGVIPIMPSKK